MQDQDKNETSLVDDIKKMRQQIADQETTYERAGDEQHPAAAELETLTRILSQDLRGALGLIISFVQVLQEYHTALLSAELQRYLDMIAKKGHKAIAVIDQVLEKQIERPATEEAAMEALDMADIVAKALDIVDYMIEDYQAEINLPESWPMARGYAPWVEEVWFNYLSNAIQYGGRPPRVELGATRQADDVIRFWVRDNGQGLTPQEQERLFKPSAQAEQVPPSGYGLGLIIVRRIVEKLGGEFGVESEGVPGQGSLFFFTLPGA